MGSHYRRKTLNMVSLSNPVVTVKTEAGAPVQLSDLRPITCEDLIRVGNQNDGGYVVPSGTVEEADSLLSFGLSHDWTFEREFRKRNPGAVIHCYDHTVSQFTAILFSAGQLARFLARFKIRYLRRVLSCFDYAIFFRGDVVHFRNRIWRNREGDSVTVDDAMGRLRAKSRIFVKIDIEGSEYNVISDVLRYASRISTLVVEFHGINAVPYLFNSIIQSIKRDFYIVHIHGNNLGGVAPFQFPTTAEITFLNKSLVTSQPRPSQKQYPVVGLDQPNHPELPDFKLEF